MISKFCLSINVKTGIMSKTLLLLAKNNFKPVNYSLKKTESKLLIDLESENAIKPGDLDFIPKAIPDVLSIEMNIQQSERPAEIQESPPESEQDIPTKLYRGQEVAESENQPLPEKGTPAKKQVHIYRGKVIGETPEDSSKTQTKSRSKKPHFYRGQRVE